MSKFNVNGHNYETHFMSAITSRFSAWFGSYKRPKNLWVSHGDGCCDYWQSEGIVEAIMQDDKLGVKK